MIAYLLFVELIESVALLLLLETAGRPAYHVFEAERSEASGRPASHFFVEPG